MRRVLLLAILLGLAAVPDAKAQLSPGDLSRFHQALEGARNCATCHEAGKGVTAERCLTCHTALGQRIAAGKGLHARSDYRACERCHVEHQGRAFEIVFWGKEGKAAFDHALTGFALEGRHARLACETCHSGRRIQNPSAISRGGANLARTFLGLGTSCTSCHSDPHGGQFVPRGCADCHSPEQWKPPSVFDHEERKSIRNINKTLGVIKAMGPWKEEIVRAGGKTMSLDHVEHEIIRKRFPEPRIHFALVCAARSCPPLRREAYTGERLDDQLDDQARIFIAQSPDKNRVDVERATAHLSPIFSWFKDDFGPDLGRFLARYVPEGPARRLLESGRFKTVETTYDWALNGVGR